MTRGSLRFRLVLSAVVSILAALILSAFGLTLLFERHVERRVAAELEVYLDQLVAGLDRGADGNLALLKSPADPRFEQPLSGLYWQIGAGGPLLRSRSLWDTEVALPVDELADGAVHQHRIVRPGGIELLALERSVALPARLGGETVRAAVALDTRDIRAATRSFAADLLPYIAVIALFLMVAAYAQVAVGLAPLATVRKQLAGIREGRARRLGREFPDEILPLAEEVDALLEARESQIEKARSRAADLAHGLKTPLQVLSSDAERLRVKGEGEIAFEIEQLTMAMRRHVDHELARARMAAGGGNARARIAEVVERVLAVVVRTPDGGRIEWSVEIPADMVGRIDPDDLAEAVGNLVENAARHARTSVSISARQDNQRIAVTVADDGPGIPEERLEEAIARGGQLDTASGGSGLGLAIVRDIAEAWGGRLEIRTGPTGLEAQISLQR